MGVFLRSLVFLIPVVLYLIGLVTVRVMRLSEVDNPLSIAIVGVAVIACLGLGLIALLVLVEGIRWVVTGTFLL